VRLLAVLAIVLGSCQALPLGDGPRRLVVRAIGDEVIVPAHRELADRAAALSVAIRALTDAPDQARLDDAQAAWRAAREPWMEGQAFRIGPVKDRVLDAAIDQFPVDPVKIEAEIAGTMPIDAGFIASLGANKKGFHGLEYLLFDPTFGDAAVLAALEASPRRAVFLAALAVDLAVRATELRDAWTPEGQAYVETFADVGSAGGTFATIKQAIDGLVNESVFLSENITDAKLGKPLGLEAGTPAPELAESGPSDNSLADIAGNLRGLRNVWLGTRDGSSGTGLRSLIAGRSPSLAVRVDTELAAAQAAVAAVPRPFATAVTGNAPEALAAWTAVRELRMSIAVEVVAVLGSTLSFNDNDGD
jgi:putative iron-regulated protein